MSGFRLRDYTPRGLYARLGALVAVPVIAIFAIFAIYYYQEHISDVNEKLSQSIAREVGMVIDICADPEHDLAIETDIESQLGLRLDCAFEDGTTWPEASQASFGYGRVLRGQLDSFANRPVEVRTIESGRVLDFRSTIDTAPSAS